MIALYGDKIYDFVPRTLFYPLEIDSLKREISHNPSSLWIFKPCASSQGKGIFVTSTLDEVPQK